MTTAPTAATAVTGAAPPASATAPANVVGVIAVPGGNVSTQQTADGSRTIVTTRSTDDTTGTTTYFVSVVNTATGTQVGNTFTATMPPRGPMSVGPNPTVQLLGDDKRAVITTPQGSATMLTTIDTGTGAVMSTNSVAGNYLSAIAPVGDGRIVMITTTDGDGLITRPTTSYISFVDTAIGDSVGMTTGLPGTAQPVQFSPDGSRVIVESRTSASALPFSADYTSTIALFDTTTGQQIGSAFQGHNLKTVIAGNNAVLTTFQPTGRTTVGNWSSTPIYAPQVTFLNLVTGQQSGDTMTYPSGSATTDITTRLSSDGPLATVTSVYHSATPNTGPDQWFRPYTWHSTTMVETFDTGNSQQVGETLVATDVAAKNTWVRPDGALAIVTTEADGNGAINTVLIDTSTSRQTGSAAGAPQFTADNSRVVVIATSPDSGTTRAAVFDLTTGRRLSDTDIAGSMRSSQLTADGTRAIITTSLDSNTTHMAVLNLTTGEQLGTTDIAGLGSAQLTADGTRAVVLTTSGGTTHATVIDTTAGQLLATTDIAGTYPTAVLTAGGRAVVTATDSSAQNTVRVAVIDTVTGRQLGSTTSLADLRSQMVTADGTRAIFTGGVDDPQNQNSGTYVVVLNTANGQQLANFDIAGGSAAMVLTANNSHALITTIKTDTDTGQTTTGIVTVLNLTTGQRLGSLTMPETYPTVQVNGSGTRAIVTGTNYDATTGQVIASTVAVVDVNTGRQLSSLTENQSGILSTQFATHGDRAVAVTSSSSASSSDSLVKVIVLDTNTGQTADRISIDLHTAEFKGIDLTLDGTRALIKTQTHNSDSNTDTTQLTVINTHVMGSGSTDHSIDGFRSDVQSLLNAIGGVANSTVFSLVKDTVDFGLNHVVPLLNQAARTAAKTAFDGLSSVQKSLLIAKYADAAATSRTTLTALLHVATGVFNKISVAFSAYAVYEAYRTSQAAHTEMEKVHAGLDTVAAEAPFAGAVIGFAIGGPAGAGIGFAVGSAVGLGVSIGNAATKIFG